MYVGDIRLGDTIDVKFTTRRFSTGAPFTLAGSPAVAAYVGNGTTEITAGITLTTDFDSRTGLNNIRVVATSGNGFATATNVQLVITAGTVDGVSVVGEVVGTFSIEARSALMPTTAARTLLVGTAGQSDANVTQWSGTNVPTPQTAGVPTVATQEQLNAGTAQAGAANTITLATSASTTTGLYVGCRVVIISGTGAGQSRYITWYTTGRVASVARTWTTTPDATSVYIVVSDNQAPFVHMGLAAAGAAGSITFDSLASATDETYTGQLCRILTGTGDNQIRLITAYNGTTKVATVSPNWTTTPDSTSVFATTMSGPARVDAMSADVVTASAIATDAIGSAELAASAVTEIQSGLSTLDAAGVRTAVGLASANLDTQLSGIQSDTDNIQTRIPAALVSGRMDSSVGAMATGVVTATAIAADAITDAKVASDVTIASVTGSVGSVTGAVGSVTGNVGGNVVGSVASVTAGVTVSTNNDKTGYGLSSAAIQAIWDAATSALTTVGSIGKWILDKLDVVVSTRLASASYTAPLDAAGTRSAVGLASANLDTQLSGIQSDTDDIQTKIGTPAGASVSADILTIDNLVDDLEARLGTPSNLGGGATIAANLADIEAQTDDIGAAGAGLTAITNQTDQLVFTSGKVNANIKAVNDVTVTGTGTVGDEWGP